MENKDFNQVNNDYCSPEQEPKVEKPVYETAEEYNNAQKNATDYSQYYNTENYSNSYENNNQQYSNPQYSNPQYGNTQYNQQYSNVGGTMVDAAGVPIKSYFAVQLVFAIVEILLCCFSPIAMVLGIIALVFAIQANTAYQQKRAEDFKSKSKTSNILLIIGGVFAVISIIFNLVFFSLFAEEFETALNEYSYEDEYDYDYDEDEYDYDEDEYDDYDEEDEDVVYGPDDVPLPEGFEDFTLDGVAFTVPMPYSDFAALGYVLEEGYSEDYVIDAESYESMYFYDDAENLVGVIRASNDTEEELTVKECVIDYICFDNPGSYYDDGSVPQINITFGQGFDMTTTYEELEAWLGTPYYQSISDDPDDSGYARYEWVYYGEDEYHCFAVTYLNGVISDITFEKYDFVY